MKKNFYVLFLLGMLLVNIQAIGQKTVIVVEPDEGIDIGALNNAITSASDPGNTIFELKRDGTYLLNGTVSHTGYTLHIRAEVGNGLRPILQPAVDELGSSSDAFSPGGNLILEGLYITAKDELGAVQNRIIVASGDGNRIIIEDCFLDYSNQTFFRLNSSNNKVYVRNSILRNSVRPENPDNGRVLDLRGNPQDTISIENSTLYNNSGTMVRTGGGFMKYLNINHNTIFQVHYERLPIDLNTALVANVTNNIFYNVGLSGDPHEHSPLFATDSIYTIGEYTDADRQFNLTNNNWYTQQEFSDILEQYSHDVLFRFSPEDTDNSDTIWYKYTIREDFFADTAILDTAIIDIPVLINFIKAGQADTTNNIKEELTFKNPPPLFTEYWQFFAENEFNLDNETPPSPFADENPAVIGEVTEGAFDFGYNASSQSATASTDGGPLGDPRWTLFTPVSAAIVSNSNSITAFPNPFSNTVIFGIDSEKSASAKISIYDMLGKDIVTMQKQILQGNNSVQMDLSKISKPGIYLYKIHIDLSDGTSSISNGKLIKK